MTRVVSIVEGDGEVAALPVLLRRLAQWRTPTRTVHIQSPPIRVRRDRFLNRPEEFSRYLQLAAKQCGPDGWILILLDADDDCPAQAGADALRRARDVVQHHRVAVVMPNREFEAWFLACAASLNGVRGLRCAEHEEVPDPEGVRNAKGWVDERMADGYGPTRDQAALTASLNLERAHARSRSFRKLCAEWDRHMALA